MSDDAVAVVSADQRSGAEKFQAPVQLEGEESGSDYDEWNEGAALNDGEAVDAGKSSDVRPAASAAAPAVLAAAANAGVRSMLDGAYEAMRTHFASLKGVQRTLQIRGGGTATHDGVFLEFLALKRAAEQGVERLYTRQTQATLAKNRYMDILPIDSTRVRLPYRPGQPAGDYINANYIKGFSGRVDYIATQAPIDTTIDDFWRMCWVENTTVILMLTRIIEGRKRKSTKYWPDAGAQQQSGDVTIRNHIEYEKSGFIVRKMQLTKGNETREVLQVQYTSWPDYEVPKDNAVIAPMLAFVRNMREEGKPTIIHCSAGVGRTGTFAAIDILLEELEVACKNEQRSALSLDVRNVVATLRSQRAGMVMSPEQYEFIYCYLLENAFGRRGA